MDWAKIAPDISIKVLGEPTKKTSTEYRWGRKHSLRLDLEKGLFMDYENDQGGGVIWFLKDHQGLDPDAYLEPYKDNVLIDTEIPLPKVQTKAQKITNKEMHTLKQESDFYVRYSEDFCVMRFPADHKIKMKYAPFSVQDNHWVMKRPEGILPIFVSDKRPEDYVVINEGEKAMRGAEAIWNGDVCCWHGGVSNWDKCNWSPLANRKIIIWPDNDDVGKKVAFNLQQHLEKICKEVIVVKPPQQFKEKDDLWDAKVNDFFESSEQFLQYCLANKIKKRVSFQLIQASQIMSNLKKPEWLIENICERDSVMAIFGKPKSGKSFIAVDMAASLSLGIPFHGHKTKQAAVVYVCGEGNRGIARRLHAFQSLHKQNLTNAPLLLSTRGARMLDEKDHQMLKDNIDLAQDKYGQIGMIVIDTLARSMNGDENSTSDMNAFIEKVDDLKDSYGAAVNLIHHTGHGTSQRARGSSALPGALDWEYRCERKDMGTDMFLTLEQTLVKDGNPMKPLNFKFVEQRLPFFDDMSSGALQIVDLEDMPKERILSDSENVLYELIRDYQAKSKDPVNAWLRHKDIINLCDIPKSTMSTALKRLVNDDKLIKTDLGYKTKEFESEDFNEYK